LHRGSCTARGVDESARLAGRQAYRTGTGEASRSWPRPATVAKSSVPRRHPGPPGPCLARVCDPAAYMTFT